MRSILLIVVGEQPGLGDVIRELEGLGYRVGVSVLPSEALLWSAERVLEALRGEHRGYEVVVVPGSLAGDYCSVAARMGVRVVKGTRSLRLLPMVLREAGIERLSCGVEAEKAVPEAVARAVGRILEDIKAKPPEGVAYEIGGLRVPWKPPPILVISEVYACRGDTLAEAEYRVESGADAIALGRTSDASPQCYLRELEELLESLNVPVAADPGDLGLLTRSLEMGAQIGMSLTRATLDAIPRRLRGEAAYVIVASDGDPSGELVKAAKEAYERGYTMLVLDPIAYPPVYPGLLYRLNAAGTLSKERLAPVMLGISNVVEMLDADTQGSTALAVALAAEAGVSLILTGEESTKARGNTLEARIASDLVSAAKVLKTPPKDLGLSLILAKSKRPLHVTPARGPYVEVELEGRTKRIHCSIEGFKALLSELKTVEDLTGYTEKLIEAYRLCIPWLGLRGEE